jgi:DNA-binding transcriptional MocR family regulator
MSFDATRATWAARDAGAIEGGPPLYVALALADRAQKDSGELQAGTRALAARLGMSRSTVTHALRELEAAGVVEATQRGCGTRATRWRWLLAAPHTASTHHVDNGTQRYPNGTQAEELAVPKNGQRTGREPLEDRESNETRTRYLNQGKNQTAARVETDLPEHLRDGTDPAEVPERVAELREALGGRWRRGAPPNPPRDEHAAAPALGGVDEVAAWLAEA